jgi:single-strand DNA-binding protein
MSTGVNQVTLVGYLAADQSFATRRLARLWCHSGLPAPSVTTTRPPKSARSSPSSSPALAWFSAEYVGKNARKGTLVHVFGRLTTRSWETKSGEKRYTTEVNCEQVNLLARYGSDTDSQHQQAKRDGYQPPPPQAPPGDDDIPF